MSDQELDKDITINAAQRAGTAHRRVLGNLGQPISFDDLLVRMAADEYCPIDVDGAQRLETILGDLMLKGYARSTHDSWQITHEGLAMMTGPIPDEPPPMTEEQAIEARGNFDLREQDLIKRERERWLTAYRAAVAELEAQS